MSLQKVLIFDGFVDEPSTLGVPPYLSPYIRYVYGAAHSAFLDTGKDGTIDYMTITEFRKIRRNWKSYGKLDRFFSGTDVVVLVNNTPVPGNYLRGRPSSKRELREVTELARSRDMLVISWKTPIENAITIRKDVDAYVYDLLSGEGTEDRYRTTEEWDRWAEMGAGILPLHQDHPATLMSEVDTLKGCVRYVTGGCSFCTDPLEPFRMRAVDSVLNEVKALVKEGGRNVRLAGSCVFSYQSHGIGKTERPKPDPKILEKLFKGIRELLPQGGTFHTDNANPGIMASHPEEAMKILRSLVTFTSPGNSLSLGMESADPVVIKRNHLNAQPEEVMEAVRMINEMGKQRGENGMPQLLPGLNFLYGLPGEREGTFQMNYAFVRGLMEQGMLFRRINIRQLSPVRIKGLQKNPQFNKWKQRFRDEIDVPNLRRIIPLGTILREVHIEVHHGGVSFGRQIGTYPILVGIPFEVEMGKTVDVKINGHGKRSVTGIPVPFDLDHASMKALTSLPGIGKKRAARIIRNRPIRSFHHLVQVMENKEVAAKLNEFCLLE